MSALCGSIAGGEIERLSGSVLTLFDLNLLHGVGVVVGKYYGELNPQFRGLAIGNNVSDVNFRL